MQTFSVAFKSVREIIFHVYTIFSLYTFRMYETKLKELETDIAKKTRSLTDLKQLVRQATEREQRVKKYTADLEQQASGVLVSPSLCARACVCVCVCVCVFSCSLVSDSLWPMDCSTAAPLSMGFPRQEYWSGRPFPSPGDLPSPGIEPASHLLHCRQILYHQRHLGSPK